MKKVLMSITLLLVFHPVVRAEDITLDSVLKFSSGIMTSFMIHESAHAFVADLNNIDLDWQAGTYDQLLAFRVNGDISDSDGVPLHSSGLISQIVGSEIILRSEKIDKNSAYVRGIMVWNIINPILYSLDYWFIRRSNKEVGNQFQGDIEGVENHSSDSTANRFAIVMAGLAVYQGSHYLKTQDWFKEDLRSFSFGVQPSGAIGFKYELWF